MSFAMKTDKELIAEYIAEGKVTYCRPGKATGIYPRSIYKRGKKNLTYSDAPMGMRTMNFESVYNIPSTYNGTKLGMGGLYV